jgi:hypothetical protein
MPWHDFIEGKPYTREEIVAKCEERIRSGKVGHQSSALRELEDIRMCPHRSEKLVWHPFGNTSHGRCPWNRNAWRIPSR